MGWDAGTVMGKGHKGALVTLTERCNRLTLIGSANTKKVEIVSDAIVDLLRPHQDDLYPNTYGFGK
ncbi:MAG: IS30 family transposase [Arenicella sp.]